MDSGLQVKQRPNIGRSVSEGPAIVIEHATINPGRKSLPPKQRSLSLETLIANAKLIFDEDEVDKARFVETAGCKLAFKTLIKYRCVGIIGPTCSGKSTIVRHIVNKCLRNNSDSMKLEPVLLNKPTDWDLVPKIVRPNSDEDKYIVIIKNMFGVNSLKKDLIEEWIRNLEAMDKMLKRGQVFVVFTCKTLIFNKCKSNLNYDLFDKDRLVFLHEDKFKITDGEGIKILEKLKIPPDQIVMDNLSKTVLFYNCRNLIKVFKKSKSEDRLKLFQKSHEFWDRELKNLADDPESLSALLMILLLGENVTSVQLREDSVTKSIVRQSISLTASHDMETSCQHLVGSFLTFDVASASYSFIENDVRDCVLSMIWRRDGFNHKEIIARCPLDLILDRITTECPAKKGELLVVQQDIQNIARRLPTEIRNNAKLLECSGLYKGSFMESLFGCVERNLKLQLSDTLFVSICYMGDYKCLKLIHKFISRTRLHDTSEEGAPIVNAIKSKIDSRVKTTLLVEYRCEVGGLGKYNRNILHYISEYWDVANILHFIKEYQRVKPLINTKDSSGQTPFQLASLHNNDMRVLVYLKDIGADVNHIDNNRKTALQLVLENRDADIDRVELLVNLDARMNCDGNSWSVFHLVCSLKSNVGKMMKLLANGTNKHLINSRDMNGLTPLHYAVREENLVAVGTLLDLDAQSHTNVINIQDKEGLTPLHYAVKRGNIEIVRELLDHGADVSIEEDGDSLTPSPIECETHRAHNVINTQDKEGLTPLHYAVKRGNFAIARELLDHGADVSIEEDDDNLTPLSIACKTYCDNDDIVNIVKLLIARGADVNHRHRFNETPLHEATENGLVHCVECLLENGANVNSQSKCNKKTPLHMILKTPKRKRVEILGLLIKYGANGNIRDGNDKTVLDLAKKSKRYSDIEDCLANLMEQTFLIKV
ncbi:uncharacterized protein LOC126827399 [Patella vulgata]|uniref:uncharacterized protein LOC126827399 n=1 Tax=Patella vulgata TaxID=6465 RepID=UPI00218083AD|nr:uncharacterized protein LOC126827399 [Patella vulgata]